MPYLVRSGVPQAGEQGKEAAGYRRLCLVLEDNLVEL